MYCQCLSFSHLGSSSYFSSLGLRLNVLMLFFLVCLLSSRFCLGCGPRLLRSRSQVRFSMPVSVFLSFTFGGPGPWYGLSLDLKLVAVSLVILCGFTLRDVFTMSFLFILLYFPMLFGLQVPDCMFDCFSCLFAFWPPGRWLHFRCQFFSFSSCAFFGSRSGEVLSWDLASGGRSIYFLFWGFGAAGCIAIFFCFHFSFPFCLCLCRSFLSLSFSVFLLFPLSFSLPLLSLAFVPYHDRVDLSFFLSKYILTLFFTVRLHTCSGSSAL